MPVMVALSVGRKVAQRSSRMGQRLTKGQPGGEASGLGRSPDRMIFGRLRCVMGSASGIADSGATLRPKKQA